MGERARRRRRCSTDLERHDGNAALGRAPERLREALWITRRFEKQANDLHLRPFDGIGDVIGDRRARLAAGRHRQCEAQARIVMRERAEHAAGMGDQGDRPRRGLARTREAAYPHPVELVVEAHAVRPADGNASLVRDALEPPRERRIAVAGDQAGREDDRRLRAGGDGGGERPFQPLVPDRQDREIRRGREIGEARHARVTFDLAAIPVHRMDKAREAAATDHPHHVVAGRIRPCARPDERNAARGEERREALPLF